MNLNHGLWVLAGVVLFAVNAQADATNEYLGSLEKIIPPVEWRESTRGKPETLDPVRDQYRSFYQGNQFRCGENGRVKLALRFGKSMAITSREWTNAPATSLLADPVLRAIYQGLGTNTAPAGWQRGQQSARRALLIGINNYGTSKSNPSKKPGRRSWTDLDGCVNDVEAVRALLVARFGFTAGDITVLTNQAATRQGIFSAIQKHLIEPAQPGDIAFLFYAGHGSQVANSKSPEADQKDESIVPADSARGALDIRDKEIRRRLNAILDRGAVLTAIFDSCHSGSVSRGSSVEEKNRFVEPDPRDAADGSDPGPDPKERGALIISAALDTQPAGESKYEGADHGAFTASLVKVLRSINSFSTAADLFLAVKAALQSDGRLQEPILEANEARSKRTLLGDQPGAGAGRVTVAVRGPSRSGEMELLGGKAIGLCPNCELKRVDISSKSTSPRLRITTVENLTRSTAKVIQGDVDSIKAGDLFEVDVWFTPDEAILRVWLPPANLAAGELMALKPALEQLRQALAARWVEDPTLTTPSNILSWSGSSWELSAVGETSFELGRKLDASAVLEKLTAGARLFAQLPPPKELAAGLSLGQNTKNNAIDLVSKPAAANYLLLGRWQEGAPQYAWVLPNTTEEVATNLSLPVRTDWVGPTPDANPPWPEAADRLRDYAQRLGKVKAWLQLDAPPGEDSFPYRLVLKPADNKGESRTGGRVREGERFFLALKADTARLGETVEPRHVYVFNLDCHGRGTLLYASTGNKEDKVPYPTPEQPRSPAEITLKMPRPLQITPPFGMDTYVMLATTEALPNPSVLEFDGVLRSAGTIRGSDTALQRLLSEVGSQARGAGVPVPTDWCVQRLTLRSVKAR